MSFVNRTGSGCSALGLVLTCLLTSPVVAQSNNDSANSLEEVIVTSSRIPQARRNIGTSVEVVSAEEIRDYGNASLVEILRQQASVAATTSGGPGKTTALRIRGEEGYRTLALFDGMRLSDPSAPQIAPLFEHMVADGVGRVEILKGPQGLGYGADAGGVVNITSPVADFGNRVFINSEWGEFGTSRNNLILSGANSDVDYFLLLSDLGSDGHNVRKDDTVLQDNDGYENTTIHARLGWQLRDGLKADLVLRDVDASSEYDGCFTTVQVHDCLSDNQQQAGRASLEYSGDGFVHNVSVARVDTDRREYAGGAFAFGNKGQLDRVEYTGNLSELPGFDLVFGADWERAEADGNSRDNGGLFIEYLSDFSERLFINIGTRYDDNDDFGSNTSYRVSTAWLAELDSRRDLKFKASFGTGFRAPSLYEIAYNRGPFAAPPASTTDLRQETSRGWEAGVEFATDTGLFAEAVYFDQEIDDAIEFDLATFSGYVQDVGSSHSRGVELSMELPLSATLKLLGNYTWNDTSRPDGRQRLRRPEHQYNAGLGYHSSDERLQANLFYRAARNSVDETFTGVVPLSDYSVVDANLSFSLLEQLDVFVRIENLGDSDFEEVTGYNNPGRAIYGGLRLRL